MGVCWSDNNWALSLEQENVLATHNLQQEVEAAHKATTYSNHYLTQQQKEDEQREHRARIPVVS